MDDQIIAWDERYSVGVPSIDSQHKKLLEIANDLYKACRTGSADKAFADAVHGAVDYVKVHFAFEEGLLQAHGYPDFAAHKKEHEAFVLDVIRQVQEFTSGKPFVPNAFVRSLRDWTLQHIAMTDKRYSVYLAERGVK